MPASFLDDLAGFSDGAGGATCAVEVWLTKLEQALRSAPLAELRAQIADLNVVLAAAAWQGGLIGTQDAARDAAWDLFHRRLDLCGELGIPTMVVVPDFHAPFDVDDLPEAIEALRQAGAAAAQRGVRIALEFQARSPFPNNVESAALLAAAVSHPHVGLCLDLFHYTAGPSKAEDLRVLSAANLFHVQVCDVADRPRELMADADRILPQEGDFQFDAVLSRLREIGYKGYVSLELLNPALWQSPPRQLAEIGWTSLRMLLGMAERAHA